MSCNFHSVRRNLTLVDARGAQATAPDNMKSQYMDDLVLTSENTVEDRQNRNHSYWPLETMEDISHTTTFRLPIFVARFIL